MPKINVNKLTTSDLEVLKQEIEYELSKREKKPEILKKTIYFNDGCEGFYCNPENLSKINAEEFKEFMIQTITNGSELRITQIEMSIENYEHSCAKYEWEFDEEN